MPCTEEKQCHLMGLFYTNHQGWMHHWLQRKLGCRQRAEDLTQDVFVRLIRRNERVEEVREPRAWLSSIARGLLVDHWRRKALEQAWIDTLMHSPAPATPSPEERVEIIEELVVIDRMLRGLKKRTRSAFLLARLEGLTCHQISTRLGVSRATVERDLAQALRACYRARFERESPAP
nr:sigma-70 family RNA polymerase sigma factor [uncultured Desulfuromonas sp.]